MKIGVCGGIERAPIIKKLGFDYIEENLSKTAGLTEDKFEELLEKYRELGLPVYSFNCFFGDVSMYAENSVEEIKKYASRALERAYRLGGKICVIGSGKARAIPAGESREFAEQRFTDIVSLCADIANEYGIKIVIEPLNSHETNFVNTVSAATRIAESTCRENVGALVDFFHFFMENESEDGVISNADSIVHAHIARPNEDRLSPKAEDVETVAHWAELLKSIGYDGAISLECRYKNFEDDIKEARKYMEFFR